MASPVNNKNTPRWRSDIDDILADLEAFSDKDHFIIISPMEASIILDEIKLLRDNRCPICKVKVCQYEVICSKCFTERQGSS